LVVVKDHYVHAHHCALLMDLICPLSGTLGLQNQTLVGCSNRKSSLAGFWFGLLQ
jgi:hypothetical protein